MKDLNSALWTAVLTDDYDLARQLICSGANVNEIQPCRPISGPAMTLLHYTAMKGDVQLVRLLIKHGANCNGRDIHNRTPLHSAVMMNDHPEVIEVLINGGAIVDARNDEEETPFLLAMSHGFIQSAEKLIASGASIDAVQANGHSALHLASMSSADDLSIVKFLISHKININVQSVDGFTPLYCALLHDPGNTKLIELLLDNGADVNKKKLVPSGNFPLFIAVYYYANSATVHLLLKRGARVNEANNAGNTALHEACENEIEDVTALLLKFGADMNACNCTGKTPFDLLPKSPSSEGTARIIIREAVKREALGQFVYEGYKQMVQSDEMYSRFDRECREEIERMRSERIDVEHSVVSFFNILSNNEEKLVALARNEKIVTAFERRDYLTIFRIYADDLSRNFEMAKERANFLLSVEDDLVDMLGDIWPVPIVRKVAEYYRK